MNKFFSLLVALTLVPLVSHAKIGETRADFEARNGKPDTLETVIAKLPQQAREASLESTKELFGDVQICHAGTDSMVAAWYKLGKVVGEVHPTKSEEDVIKVLQDTIGTSDLDEYASDNPIIKLLLAFAKGTPFESYITKDQKFIAYVIPTQGVFVGTKVFAQELEGRLTAFMAEQFTKSFASPSPAPSVSPDQSASPTPANK
jgi:hypothetical protein